MDSKNKMFVNRLKKRALTVSIKRLKEWIRADIQKELRNQIKEYYESEQFVNDFLYGQ